MAKSCFRVLVVLLMLASYASEVAAYKSKEAGETKKGWMGDPPD